MSARLPPGHPLWGGIQPHAPGSGPLRKFTGTLPNAEAGYAAIPGGRLGVRVVRAGDKLQAGWSDGEVADGLLRASLRMRASKRWGGYC